MDEEETEEACLDRLHKWRALQKLKDLRDQLGEDQWRELCETFASVRHCGYSDAEIDAARDAPLFIRLDAANSNANATPRRQVPRTEEREEGEEGTVMIDLT